MTPFSSSLMENNNFGNIHKISILAFLIHLLLLVAVKDIYFATSIEQELEPIKSTNKPPAKRVFLFVMEGLRVDKFFEFKQMSPFLTKIKHKHSSWGVSHAGVPTELTSNLVSMLAGVNENPTAIFRGLTESVPDVDTVLSYSEHVWGWGSTTIMNIFKIKTNLSNVHYFPVLNNKNDFTRQTGHDSDNKIFQETMDFLTLTVKNCETNCEQYSSGGNIFFLHLPSFDIIGHEFKPAATSYAWNIKLADSCINLIADMVNREFKDKATAFIVTADHGMTDWGSHGGESLEETDTPFVAWGAGISAINMKQDINQIDIAPLIAYLIGINFPTNSLGIIRTSYLSAAGKDAANVVRANTDQLLSLFTMKKSKIVTSAMIHIPCSMDDAYIRRKMGHLEKVFNWEHFDHFLHESQEFMLEIIQGIKYYQNYYSYPVLISLTVGCMIWIRFLMTAVHDLNLSSKDQKKANVRHLFLVCLVLFFCIFSRFSFRYYTYFLFPVIMFIVFSRTFSSSLFSLKPLKSKHYLDISFYFIGIEMIICGFFYRKVFTILMLFLCFLTFKRYTASNILNLREKIIWVSCCSVLSIFPMFPNMQTSFNVHLYFLGSLGMMLICLYFFWNDLKMYKSEYNIEIETTTFNLQFFCILLATSYILLMHIGLISCSYLSWIITIVPVLLICRSEKFIAVRLHSIFFGLMPFYLLTSTNYEVAFSILYAVTLWVWLLNEVKLFRYDDNYTTIYISKFQEYQVKNEISADDVRRAYIFMVFIAMGFFGGGNIASLSSFDPMWAHAFLTNFTPFKVAAVVICKLSVPFIFACCVFKAINTIGRENVVVIFCIVLIFSNVMVLQFLYLITIEGSPLEIGTSLSHFFIMEAFVLITMLLYGIAHLITVIKY